MKSIMVLCVLKEAIADIVYNEDTTTYHEKLTWEHHGAKGTEEHIVLDTVSDEGIEITVGKSDDVEKWQMTKLNMTIMVLKNQQH